MVLREPISTTYHRQHNIKKTYPFLTNTTAKPRHPSYAITTHPDHQLFTPVMKLINTTTLQITEFFDRNVPPYAILSHTWITDQEVTYQELLASTATHKTGYRKIQQCCAQALTDNLHWAWVDTCCIDKSSSAELTESINSMFRYYAEAQICYAYLADVQESGDMVVLEDALEQSRWFTRGWTLQELLAPQKLLFYSRDWKALGGREKWRHHIAHITKIHEEALRGGAVACREFSIAQKMSWASGRQSTRDEDNAYSLLGLFDVQMPLLYGEGTKAFIRLQEEIMKSSDDQSIFAWEYD
ncbi:HET-domain-containing protein, partial [Microthyrium microscopicum]